jgi:hypothetical protein
VKLFIRSDGRTHCGTDLARGSSPFLKINHEEHEAARSVAGRYFAHPLAFHAIVTFVFLVFFVV